MYQKVTHILRIARPMGKPDIIECDGMRYVPLRTAHIDFFEGDEFCTACKNYVDMRDTFCRHCGAKFEHGWRYLGTVAANAAGEVFQPLLKQPPTAAEQAREKAMKEAFYAQGGAIDRPSGCDMEQAEGEPVHSLDETAAAYRKALCQNCDKTIVEAAADAIRESLIRAGHMPHLLPGA